MATDGSNGESQHLHPLKSSISDLLDQSGIERSFSNAYGRGYEVGGGLLGSPNKLAKYFEFNPPDDGLTAAYQHGLISGFIEAVLKREDVRAARLSNFKMFLEATGLLHEQVWERINLWRLCAGGVAILLVLNVWIQYGELTRWGSVALLLCFAVLPWLPKKPPDPATVSNKLDGE